MSGDPNDQADGFHEGNADWARREAMGAYDDTWQLLFDLDKWTEAGRWDDVKKRIAAFKGDIAFHEFSHQAFMNAAAAGKLDVVQAMFGKNFRLPAEEGAEAIETLAKKHLPAAANVIGYLLENDYASGDRAVLAIAARGTPQTMEILRSHGCDIHKDGAFSLALHSGNVPMMGYLHGKGADIYGPSTVAGLFGGIARYQDANRDAVMVRGETAPIAAYRALCQQDTRDWLHYFAYVCPNRHPTLEDFRGLPKGVEAKNMNLMQIAACAGCFSEVVDAALAEKDRPLTTDDLLRTDKGGTSVLSILAARGELGQLFDVRLWWQKPEDAGRLHAALKSMGADGAIDPAAFAADIQRYRLKALAKGTNLRLRPPAP